MGRPRALKNKDVVPAVKIDTSKSAKKHRKFDEDDDASQEFEVTETSTAKASSTTATEDDDNSPEEVVQDEIQIQALKEEVENLFSVQKEAKRRRKFTKEVAVADDDEYLDEKDLQLVGASKTTKKDRDDENSVSSDADHSDDGVQVDNVGLKRKVGKIEVAVIANATLHDFQMNADAERFMDQHRSKTQRTRYTTFMSQRRPAPAKVFRSKSSAK
eukprot:gene1467-1064_t